MALLNLGAERRREPPRPAQAGNSRSHLHTMNIPLEAQPRGREKHQVTQQVGGDTSQLKLGNSYSVLVSLAVKLY